MANKDPRDYGTLKGGVTTRLKEHPEERGQWATAFYIGHTAGVLTEFVGPHPGLRLVRGSARSKLLAFIEEQPDSAALEKVSKGLSFLREEYQGALEEHPDLQWDLAMVGDLEKISSSPIVSEAVATEILRYAGFEV
jgi:hypothetical protein